MPEYRVRRLDVGPNVSVAMSANYLPISYRQPAYIRLDSMVSVSCIGRKNGRENDISAAKFVSDQPLHDTVYLAAL